MIFVTDISGMAASVELKAYSEAELPNIYTEAGDSGFSFIVIPAMTGVHSSFALNAPSYDNFGSQPLIGWIAGVHLDSLGKETPKVFDGLTGNCADNAAMVMHVTLPRNKAVDVGIVNIFEQGDGDTLTFEQTDFPAPRSRSTASRKTSLHTSNATVWTPSCPWWPIITAPWSISASRA